MPEAVQFLKTFRARLVLLLAACLALTIGVVLALDYWAQRRINEEIEKQRQSVEGVINNGFGDLMQAVSIATASLGSDKYLYETISPDEMPKTVEAIIVANSSGKITDSSVEKFIDDGKTITVPDQSQKIYVLSGDPFVGAVNNQGYAEKTYYYSTDTANLGLHWIVIVMKQDAIISQISAETNKLANSNQELSNIRQWLTTILLLFALAIAVVIGWQFTRPIQELASAARRVADSQLDFRVNVFRNDEVGQLAETFNEMIDGLKHKRELEEKLNQAERAAVIGRLTQSVAHEIRNPLNVINLSIDLVRNKFAPADDQQRGQFTRLLSSIKDEIVRLNRMVSDLLNYGRPANLAVHTFDMRSLVDETIALIRPQADDQSVEIQLDEDNLPAEVNGDREKLKSCLSNIAINALQAMPSGGSLMASVHKMNGHVEVKIADTGTGISEENLNKIFEPYFSTKQTGFGLGLAVTKKIIEEHQGTIDVQSEIGLGTTFSVKLEAAKDKD
ncbi:MAG: ATP-binding protein [Acidobacteriota bacterium]